MMMAPILNAILLACSLAWTCGIAGLYLGAVLTPEGSGLAGGAIVFWGGVGGALAGLLLGVLAAYLLPVGIAVRLRRLSLVAAVLATAAVGASVVGSRGEAYAAERDSRAPRVPWVNRADLPLGLGIARLQPRPDGVVHFYGQPRPGDSPGALPPIDTVRFRAGQPTVEIAEAPPWLVPEHLKMDYELFTLRALTLSPEWVEVIGNMRTGETWWVDRQAVQFVAWPEYLLSIHSVTIDDEDGNPIRLRPFDDSPILATTSAALPPLAVQGEWLKVATGHLADRIQPEGWVRWRRGDRLLLTCNPLS